MFDILLGLQLFDFKLHLIPVEWIVCFFKKLKPGL